MSISGDMSGLSSAGGIQAYQAEKKAAEGKLAGLNAQGNENNSTTTVSGPDGKSEEIKSGSKNNNDSDKANLKSKIDELDSKINSMRMQESKDPDKNKDKQFGNAQNQNAQSNNQSGNNKNNSVSGSSSTVQQPGQSNGSSQTGTQQGSQETNRLKTTASN